MGFISKKMVKGEKPAIMLESETGDELTCLFDTGANIPVYTSGMYELLDVFPSAVKIDDAVACLSGFGKGFNTADLYRIPRLAINSNDSLEKVEFINLVIAYLKRADFNFDMILSSTMFKHINYTICNYGENRGNLVLEYEKAAYHIAPRWCLLNGSIEKLKYEGKDVLEAVYSFTQSQSDTSTISDRVSQMEEEMKQALADVDKEFEC